MSKTFRRRDSEEMDCKDHFHSLRNKPMQYTAIFQGCKNDNFQMKKYDIFHIFAQNIDCAYIVLNEAVLTSTYNLCFRAKIK